MGNSVISTVISTLLVALGAYIAIVLILRISGKRVLSKWNAFDFVVTIALGSSLATTILSRQTTLTQGVTAFAALVFFQVVITYLSERFKIFESYVKARPRVVLRGGEFQQPAMKQERVTENEVRAAVRAKGIAALEDVEAVVLETDGSFSVIQEINPDKTSALSDTDVY